MGKIRDFMLRRKAAKMGKGTHKGQLDKPAAATAYEAWDFHQKPSQVGNASQQNNPHWRKGRTTSQFGR